MIKYPFAPIPSPEEMKAWDIAATEEAGISINTLMENAGFGAFEFLVKTTGPVEGKKILVFMGSGNNGGDGAALARFAKKQGAEVLICHLHPLPIFAEAEKASVSAPEAHLHQVQLAANEGVPFCRIQGPFFKTPAEWKEPDIIIDALLGTGAKGFLRSEYAALVQHINRFRVTNLSICSGGCDVNLEGSAKDWPGLFWLDPAGQYEKTAKIPFILSLDIPSGLGGVSGLPSPCAVAAHATVTFESPKPGLIMPAARPYVGHLHVVPVGIPVEVRQRYLPELALLLPGCALPRRALFTHKGAAGKILVIGGSRGMSGAPALSALGAFKSGAGVVCVACPSGIESQIKAHLPDVLTLPLGAPGAHGTPRASSSSCDHGDSGTSAALDGEGEWTRQAAEDILPHLKNWDAVIIGPGLGTSEGARLLVSSVLQNFDGTMVIDADALNIIAQNRALLSHLKYQDILTPHPGEAARLLGKNVADVQANRPAALKELLSLANVTVILKGEVSIIGYGNKKALSPFMEPNLSVAGSGDVLSGIVATFAVQDYDTTAFEAACAAAYVHGLAGRLLREVYPCRGNLPSEIAGMIPNARAAAEGLPAIWIPDLTEYDTDNLNRFSGRNI